MALKPRTPNDRLFEFFILNIVLGIGRIDPRNPIDVPRDIFLERSTRDDITPILKPIIIVAIGTDDFLVGNLAEFKSDY